MKKKLLVQSMAFLGAGFCGLHGNVTMAQNAASLEEVVVTSRRELETVQTTPLAVTALTGESLAERNISDVSRLAGATPALVITTSASDTATPVISLRGQVQNDISLIQLDQSVAIYMDEIYIARPIGQTAQFLDMQRVEVLRGPQGTLFGRNSTGGAVRFITNKAEVGSNLSGYLSGIVGNYDKRRFEGAIGATLAENMLAFRLSGMKSDRDGYGKSVITGQDHADDDSYGARASIAFTPTDNLSIDLAYARSESENGNAATHLLAADTAVATSAAGLLPANRTPVPPAMVEAAKGLDDYDNASSWKTYSDGSNDLYSVTINYDITDDLALSLIYGHQKYDLDAEADLFGVGYLQPQPVGAIIGEFIDGKQDSVELRVSGTSFDEKLNWQAGVYGFKEEGDTTVRIGPEATHLANTMTSGENKSYAAFSQVTYAINDDFNITAGLRYTKDDRSSDGTQTRALTSPGNPTCLLVTTPDAAGILSGPCEYSLDTQEHSLPWLLSAEYTPAPGQLAYAKIAKGYRSGGINPRGTTPVTYVTFDPESVQEVEFGYKADLLDNQLRINTAIFSDEHEDTQFTESIVYNNIPQTFISNDPVAQTIHGLELEITAILSDNWTLDAHGSWLDEQVKFASKKQGGVGLNFRQSFAGGDLAARVDWSYTDNIEFSSNVEPYNTADSYQLVNARVSWLFPGPNVEVAIYGTNLTDEVYDTQRLDYRNGVIGGANAQRGSPREYGAEVRWRFGSK